jgi:hypothetical protein
MAQVQYDALQVTVLAEKTQVMQVMQQMMQPADGSVTPPAKLPQLAAPPVLRGEQAPERFTTPDAPGSTTTKFKMAKPDLKPQGAPTAARGPVQANRNQGVRKENT